MLGDEEHTGQVDVDRTTRDVERQSVSSVVLIRELDSCVADDDVEPPERRGCSGDGVRHLGLVGEVGVKGRRGAAQNAYSDGLRGGQVEVQDCFASALARAHKRCLSADAVAATGDDRRPSCKQPFGVGHCPPRPDSVLAVPTG